MQDIDLKAKEQLREYNLDPGYELMEISLDKLLELCYTVSGKSEKKGGETDYISE